MKIEIYRRLPATPVADYAAASAAYCALQTESGEGGSTFPNGKVTDDGKQIGYVSYNGRVWLLDETAPRLVYCPGSAGEDEGRPEIFNEGRESVWGRKVPNPYAADTVEHRVFERGAAFARKAHS